MKRTTIYFAADLEMRLKREMVRRGQPMAELVREAVEAYLATAPEPGPPGGGEFASGRRDTAAHAEDVLGSLGFGEDRRPPGPPPAARRPKRRRARRS